MSYSLGQIKLLGKGAIGGGFLCSVHCPRNNRGWSMCHLVTPSLSFCPLKAPAVWMLGESKRRRGALRGQYASNKVLV